MKLTSKIITLVVVSMGFVQVVCPQEQKIVIHKGSDIDPSISSSLSAVEIVQDNQVISSAKFKKNTRGAQYGNPRKKYLFFHKDKGLIAVRFWKTAADKDARQAAIKTEVLDVPIADIPVDAQIKIGGASPFTIVFDLSKAKTTKVNVVKTPDASHAQKWTIYSLGKNLNLAGVSTPPKDSMYDKVTIAKDTTTRKLKVPNNRRFWIFVPKVPGSLDRDIMKEIPFPSTPISSNTVINISADGDVLIK